MARPRRDDAYKLYDYGFDLASRTIYLGSDKTSLSGDESGVDGALANMAIVALYIMQREDPEGIKPITILISGPGGDYYYAMGIFDQIKACKSEVIAIASGSVMSAHSIIFQAADKRIMTKNCRQMIHYGYFGASDHTKNFKNWAKESEKIDKQMEDLYYERIKQKKPRFKRTDLTKLLEFDTILNAEESIELGLADEILE